MARHLAAAAAVAALSSLPTPASAELVERIVAVVNDEIILLSDLEERAGPILAQAGRSTLTQTLSPEEQAQLLSSVLSDMVDEELVAEQATKMHVQVSSSEVDRAIKNVARQNNLSLEQFTEAIQGQGYTMPRYRNELRRQLLRFKVVRARLEGRLRVSDREVRAYYLQQVRQARADDQFRAADILVKVPPDAGAATIAQRRRRAEAILARAKAGASFEALARRYSEDAETASQGGNLGWLEATDLPSEMRDVVLGLDSGTVGGPVRTADGFHVIKVLEWASSQVRPLEEVSEEIRLRLLEQQMERQERLWLVDLRRRAYVDVRL